MKRNFQDLAKKRICRYRRNMDKIKILFKTVQAKQIGSLVTIMMAFLAMVMFSWLVGFWTNGLLGTTFDLGSCWQGISAVVSGMTGVATLAGTKYARYYLDSKYNSEDGERPRQGD